MAIEARAKGTGVASVELLPGVRLVRAFNCVGYSSMRSEAHRAGERLAIPLAADDQAALKVAIGPGAGRGLRARGGGRPRAREGIRRRHAHLRQGGHARRSCARSSGSPLASLSEPERERETSRGDGGIAASAIERSSRPSERSAANSQPPSRVRAAEDDDVDHVLRLVLLLAREHREERLRARDSRSRNSRCAAAPGTRSPPRAPAPRRAPRSPPRTPAAASASAAPTPKRAISLPVAKNCTASVSRPTARSMAAKMRVRTAGSSEAAATMFACWK